MAESPCRVSIRASHKTMTKSEALATGAVEIAATGVVEIAATGTVEIAARGKIKARCAK